MPKKRVRGVADIEQVLAKLPDKVAKMRREVAALEAKVEKLRQEKLPWYKPGSKKGA